MEELSKLCPGHTLPFPRTLSGSPWLTSPNPNSSASCSRFSSIRCQSISPTSPPALCSQAPYTCQTSPYLGLCWWHCPCLGSFVKSPPIFPSLPHRPLLPRGLPLTPAGRAPFFPEPHHFRVPLPWSRAHCTFPGSQRVIASPALHQESLGV